MKATRNRRAFLQSLGASAALLPFVRVVEQSYAQSEGEELPLRFIGVFHPHGSAAEHFTRRDDETETSFALDYPHCPLQPFDDAATYGKSYKDKIVVIEGLDLMSDANAHNSAGAILTGSRITGAAGGAPENSSLDQFLAIEHGLGMGNLVPSVALSVGNNELSAAEGLSFGERGVPISKIIDPALAFDFLFAHPVVGSDPESQALAERQKRLGQSLIDFVGADVRRLRARVGATEQTKLDQHLDALRAFELKHQRLHELDCMPPARPSAFPAIELGNGGEPYFDAITDLHIDLLALSMGCDITRFATLALGDLSFEGNPLGLPADNHAGMAHTYTPSPIGSSGNPVGDGLPETWDLLASFNHYSYGKVARLMQRLDESGILDSTLIYASSDMGNPSAHSTRNVPTVLAGGANGKIQMGRRIKYRTDCPLGTYCDTTSSDYETRPSNRLLVSIAQVFGVEIERYGTQSNEENAEGALSEL